MKILKKKIALAALIAFILVALFLLSRYSFFGLSRETLLIKDTPDVLEEPPLPFEIDEKFQYQIRFNGIRVGAIEFAYLGREKIDASVSQSANGKPNRTIDTHWQDVIEINANVSILGLFRAEGQERIYLDASTYLPMRSERRMRYLRREEFTLEEYCQKQGWVKVTRQREKGIKEKTLKAEPPIYSPLALCFLFPVNLEGEPLGKIYEFNLPAQQLSIKLIDRVKNFEEGKEEFYILESFEPRQVKVWLSAEKRIPERIEIPFFLGRVVINRI